MQSSNCFSPRSLFYCVLTLVAASQLSSCTRQQTYESIKAAQKNDCELLPMAQREACLKQLGPDFKEYDRERQKLLQAK